MRCPKCQEIEDKVIDSRMSKDGTSIRRRRECTACGHRFTTYEEIERAELHVVKRDGRLERFDRQKLLAGMMKACEKRPISLDQLEEAASRIQQELESEYSREVPHRIIGAKVMDVLHELDDIAYVRYASVYRQFQDIGEFLDEIQSLERRVRPNRNQQELFQHLDTLS